MLGILRYGSADTVQSVEKATHYLTSNIENREKSKEQTSSFYLQVLDECTNVGNNVLYAFKILQSSSLLCFGYAE